MIPDLHTHPAAWGIRPVLFSAGGHPISSYSFFVVLGLVSAAALYYFNTRGRGVGENGLYIALAAVVGGIVGAKIPAMVVNLPRFIAHPQIELLLSGRTIVGGIVGGALAVYLLKRRLGITQRLGNYLVPSLCLGILVGRIGCYLAGCCYGAQTRLPWGVDFGDGIARHPTQLYEAVFLAAILVYSQVMKDRYEPGVLFRQFVIVYFGWRFVSEFIRVNPVSAIGLTYYQVVALLVMGYYLTRNAAGSLGRSLK